VKIPGGPKIAHAAVHRRDMHGQPQKVLCSAYFLSYTGIGVLYQCS